MDEFLAQVGHLDPDVVETACLAHDLGHPPFGHVAEEALDDHIRTRDGETLEEGFEGNPQSFRIVAKLAVKGGNLQGLGLTRASLNAILKYPWPRGPKGSDRHDKWGYYPREEEAFEFARDLVPDGFSDPCLEAQIMDWADEVTYAVHDLADFYQAGYIPLHRIVEDTTSREDFLDEERVQEDVLEELGADRDQAREFFDTLDEAFYPPSLKIPFDGTREQGAHLKRFSSDLITRFLRVSPEQDEMAAVRVDTSGDHPQFEVDPQLRLEVEILRALPDVYVFGASPLLAQQAGHQRIVKRLFEEFHRAAGRDSDHRDLLPSPLQDLADYVEEAEDEGDVLTDDAKNHRIRLAADAVASLDERQAVTLYEKLLGTRAGSLRRSDVS